MNRLTLLAATACLSLFLTACGNQSEKKVETKATAEVNQSETAPATAPASESVQPESNADQSKAKLDDANKDINDELSAAALSSVNQEVAKNESNTTAVAIAAESVAQSLPESA